MSDSLLYPYALEPKLTLAIWGGHALVETFGKSGDPNATLGESWECWDENRVANGPLAGKRLSELRALLGERLLGDLEPSRIFPILTKIIDARDALSVQVHPDDAYAQRVERQPNGKTECWYVLHAEPGAQVGVGLKPGTTKAQFAEAIKQGHAEQLLNWIDIAAGDLIYVEAGTVHAIGPGSILVETQQNSDTTFRLYDYGRPRELHLEQGLEAMKEKTHAGKLESGLVAEDLIELVSCNHFLISRHVRFGLSGAHGLHLPGHTHGGTSRTNDVIVCIRGQGLCKSGNADDDLPDVSVVAGEALVIPAAVARYTVVADAESEFLSIKHPPLGETCEPNAAV